MYLNMYRRWEELSTRQGSLTVYGRMAVKNAVISQFRKNRRMVPARYRNCPNRNPASASPTYFTFRIEEAQWAVPRGSVLRCSAVAAGTEHRFPSRAGQPTTSHQGGGSVATAVQLNQSTPPLGPFEFSDCVISCGAERTGGEAEASVR
ncbi:hypothetical protein [Streptomyces sp. NPDC049744]|uniref:hypothetical protein n=1 Tax=Streptomyces sp. NPDC049744 TaxID=3154359 RepID=UPI003415AA94